jgi:hypothetical protein
MPPMEPLDHHHAEMGRAAAAAMQQHYQETIEICSELLTSGTRRTKAEVRLMLATAMHYADGHYEDIVKQLSLAMDAPPEIQKDACFTLAVVQLSFGHKAEATSAMEQCLEVITLLRQSSGDEPGLRAQQEEARQFLAEL